MLSILFLQIAFFAVTAFMPHPIWQRGQEFMQVTFAGVLGLVGSAVGYYFGSQR
ncbi:hypothetical protein BH18ACT10_BH18ACT10_07640 [soil metagenome]